MLQRVKYFQTTVALGSFTAAAAKCSVSQSAISQQIKALEEELGAQLMVREKRSFTLTPAGERFYQKSLVIVREMDDLCREVYRLAQRGDAEVRIGYLRNYVGQELQSAIAEFNRKRPNVRIELFSGAHEELYYMLRNDKLDLVLSDQRRAFSDLYENLQLKLTPYLAELSNHSHLVRERGIEVDELASQTCILIAPPAQRSDEMDYHRHSLGFGEKFLFADSVDEARLMVLSGKGFLPVLGETPSNFDTTCSVPLLRQGKPLKRNLCVFWKKDNSGYYIEEFSEILKEKFSKQRVRMRKIADYFGG